MWAVMMVAMIGAAEAPSVLRSRAGGRRFCLIRRAVDRVQLRRRALQLQLHAAGLLDHESGALTNPWLAAALLVAAGALQFTP